LTKPVRAFPSRSSAARVEGCDDVDFRQFAKSLGKGAAGLRTATSGEQLREEAGAGRCVHYWSEQAFRSLLAMGADTGGTVDPRPIADSKGVGGGRDDGDGEPAQAVADGG